MKYILVLLLVFFLEGCNKVEGFSLHKEHDVFVTVPLKPFGYNKLYCNTCKKPIKEEKIKEDL